MAKISGFSSGFKPQAVPARPPAPEPKPKRSRIDPVPPCSLCGAQIPKRTAVRTTYDGDAVCGCCDSFFGLTTGLPGVTRVTPKKAAARVEDAKQCRWVVMLVKRTFGREDGGTITLETGDVVNVSRSGASVDPGLPPSGKRTMSLFTVDVTLAGIPVTLFPHEFSPIDFASIVSLRQDGELIEAYVSPDDDVGHFTPTPALRAEIDAAFGG